MFWGIGHTVGMLLIGILFFYFRNLIPVDFISGQSEKIVGIILIIIGGWVFFRLAKKKRSSNKHSHIHLHQNTQGEPYAHFHVHQHTGDSGHNHTHSQKQGILTAAGIGTVHGFAGVSHLISLLPTMAFANKGEAVMYLIGFAGGTILSMILFSTVLGIMGKKASNNSNYRLYHLLNIVSASVAVFVGLFWIYQSW